MRGDQGQGLLVAALALAFGALLAVLFLPGGAAVWTGAGLLVAGASACLVAFVRRARR